LKPIHDIEKKRSIHSSIPVFTSDNWDSFEEGVTGETAAIT